MSSRLIIKTSTPIQGGSEFSVQTGHGGTIEICESERHGVNLQKMQPPRVILSVPKDKRGMLADFIRDAS